MFCFCFVDGGDVVIVVDGGGVVIVVVLWVQCGDNGKLIVRK